MKRSEAEKLINEWLDTASVITGITFLEFAETRLGMIPPEVMTVSPGGTFIDVNGTIHEIDSMNTFDNKWED